MTEPLLLPSTVAERLSVPERTVLNMLRLRRLAGVKVEGKWRVPPGAVDAYIAAHLSGPKPQTISRTKKRALRQALHGRPELPCQGADYFL